MHIINMINDFRVLVEESKVLGNWQAFKHFYSKYPEFLDQMIAYLYRVNLEGLEATVEVANFEALLQHVEENIYKVGIIEKLTKEVADKLEFEEEFDLYIGAGLGHISGMTLIGEKPAVYFGIECIGSSEISYLIPHEVNHMVRKWYVKEANLNTFKERVITEGLGTLYPLVFNQEEINKKGFAKVLLIPVEEMPILLEREKDLMKWVFEKMECDLTPELMKRFFTYSVEEKNQPQLVGYFIGMRIIEALLKNNQSISELTCLSADEVLKMYKEKHNKN